MTSQFIISITRYYQDNSTSIKVDKWLHISNERYNNYNDERKKCTVKQKSNRSCIHHHICHNCDKLEHFLYKCPDTFNSSKASISNKTRNSSSWLVMTKSTCHEYNISSYELINELSHEYDSFDPIINALNMMSNSKSSINEFVTLNIISNIESHINFVALSIISNMKYFIINFITLNTSSNMEYSSVYSIALITSSNISSQNSNSVTMITSSNTNLHNTNFIILIIRSNMKHLFDYYDS